MSLGDYALRMQEQDKMRQAGLEVLKSLAESGPESVGQTIYDVSQRHGLSMEQSQQLMGMIKESQAQKQAHQSYLQSVTKTESEKFKLEQDKTYAPKEREIGIAQNEATLAGTKITNATAQKNLDLLLKYGDQETKARIDNVLASIKNLDAQTQGQIIENAFKPELLKAQTENYKSGTVANKAQAEKIQKEMTQGGEAPKPRDIKDVIAATGIAPNAATTYQGTTTGRTFTKAELEAAIRTANGMGWGVNVQITRRDKDGNALEGYVTGYQPLTNGAKQTVNMGPKPKEESVTGGKPIDKATVIKFIMQAGGDVDKARQMARQQGYSF